MKRLYLLFLFFLLFPLFMTTTTLADEYYGSVSDASGDAISGKYDLISGSAQVTDDYLIFTATFDESSLSSDWWELLRISVSIDIDKDPTTGFEGVDAANTDSDIFGGDYSVSWGGSSTYIPEGYSLKKYVSYWSSPIGILGTDYTATHTSDSTTVTIPLSLFADTTVGEFNFDIKSTKILSEYGTTGVLDYMPDTGSIGTTVPTSVPEPATMLLLGTGILGLAGFRRKFKK